MTPMLCARVSDDGRPEPRRAPDPDCRCALCAPDRVASWSHAIRLRAFLERQRRERGA